ncbi:glycosyltransferase family 2 protein [Neotamlana sedimentorum]|uniref:glycosyltransferase family 2 protein n=1 Tax=Neotamlana sedimentorum TaxID=1435349 RepID=UPI000699A8E0|nr:glycosyltransferase family A protein [Tamlana sedimentorum]
MPFSLSIIIPVYNAERFITKAVESACEQPEVTEIVVIDDGSTDATQEIVNQLQDADIRIKLYHHPNKVNKGRSASRNLGIQKASGKFIAFLDADDYFLPNRFANDFKLFQENQNCDGVYNAVGFHFYRPATELELNTHQLYTVTQKVAPEALFKNLLYGKCGHFHIDGLTVKKSVFERTGLFDESLIVAEDTDIFWKMAIKSRLETGIINKPLAIRGVHEENIFVNEGLYKVYNIKMHEGIAIWCSKNQVSSAVVDDVLKWIWMLKHKQQNKLYQDIAAWARFFFSQPQLLFTMFSIKYFPVIRYRQMLFPFLYRR